MPENLTPNQRRSLAARVNYYRELGIYDFYRRESDVARAPSPAETVAHAADVAHAPSRVQDVPLDHPAAGLRIIREDLGEDCTRCKLHKQGRKQIVFGVGNPRAELMFIGEGPGADEDLQGEPFVGRAGQLLNKMIEAMGLKRSDVYIANVVKCRPPGNRTPEPFEAEACRPYLDRQIALIRPKLIVALGKSAATTLLNVDATIASLRGRVHRYQGVPLVVTYHPAYLLRNLPDKAKAWEDLCLARATLRRAQDGGEQKLRLHNGGADPT
jgi:uracil-DNA glycosylase family 4